MLKFLSNLKKKLYSGGNKENESNKLSIEVESDEITNGNNQ